MEFYSRSENSKGEREHLEAHLIKVAELTKKFASAFDEGNAGFLLGLLHDTGKATQTFQDVLDNKTSGVNHESIGALALKQTFKNDLLSIISYAHHTSLNYFIDEALAESIRQPGHNVDVNGRLYSTSNEKELQNALGFIQQKLFKYLVNRGITSTDSIKLTPEVDSYYTNLSIMLHARMLLSCLVDADFIASASHYQDEQVILTAEGNPLDPEKILKGLEAYRYGIINNSSSDRALNIIRNQVYDDCLSAANNPPGMFTLTAPTGTGKTLALMAFAAMHALINKKRRIIVVLPYLSIISQNVDIYRQVCGEVLESDSTVKCDNAHARLLAQRWNVPVIVTTSVKFFESLFKARASEMRHLHNIANSVIVFDEAQSLPPHLVGVSVESMRILCEKFGCSVVFSTATQPNYGARQDTKYAPVEIIKDKDYLYKATKRVNVEWRIKPDDQMCLSDVAREMSIYNSVCCVLNRKDHTLRLFKDLKDLCKDGSVFFMSTDMCKAHRDEVLATVNLYLQEKKPCRLVSTTCIEAGVDIDFAVMYRALAPLDSIVQCAGRCNRNGKQLGKMIVFIPEDAKQYPSLHYGLAASIVSTLNSRYTVDIDNPEHIKDYYTELYGSAGVDSAEIYEGIAFKDFDKISNAYKLIDEASCMVIVPYKGKMQLYNRFKAASETTGVNQAMLKQVSAITVASYKKELLDKYCKKVNLMIPQKNKVEPAQNLYICDEGTFYNSECGLQFD